MPQAIIRNLTSEQLMAELKDVKHEAEALEDASGYLVISLDAKAIQRIADADATLETVKVNVNHELSTILGNLPVPVPAGATLQQIRQLTTNHFVNGGIRGDAKLREKILALVE